MADQKISADPAITTIAGTELIPAVQGGINKSMTPNLLALWLATSAVGLPGFRFVYSSTTTAADPGATFVRFNNATPASITAVYLDDQTVDGVDLSTLLASLGTSGLLKFTSLTDPGEWIVLKWTAVLTDNMGWWTFIVTYQAHAGSIDNGDEVQLTLVQLGSSPVETWSFACSDYKTTAIAAANDIGGQFAPYAVTVIDVWASLHTPQTSGSIFTVDVNEAGTTILSTKLTIDNTENTTVTAGTPRVISDASIAAGAKISVDVDQIGDGTAKGLIVYMQVLRT